MAHIIAISYAAPDQAAAETIAARLDARRMPTWVAPRDVPAGRDASVATAAAFDDAQLLIAVVSGHSAADDAQTAAIAHAVATRQPVLALRIAPVAIAPPLDDALRQATIIDAFALSLEEHADRLAELLESAFDRGGVE